MVAWPNVVLKANVGCRGHIRTRPHPVNRRAGRQALSPKLAQVPEESASDDIATSLLADRGIGGPGLGFRAIVRSMC